MAKEHKSAKKKKSGGVRITIIFTRTSKKSQKDGLFNLLKKNGFRKILVAREGCTVCETISAALQAKKPKR